jgi:hypothetical protein
VLCLPEETDADEDQKAAADVSPEGGTPFVLTPFQQFIVGSLFGWFAYVVSKRTGARRLQQRFRIAYFEGGKGCGKTPMGAGILIFLLVRHGVRGAQLFCAAVTKEQAKIAFADCVKMVAASPALHALITVLGHNLSVKSTGSFIRPISAEAIESLYGPGATAISPKERELLDAWNALTQRAREGLRVTMSAPPWHDEDSSVRGDTDCRSPRRRVHVCTRWRDRNRQPKW